MVFINLRNCPEFGTNMLLLKSVQERTFTFNDIHAVAIKNDLYRAYYDDLKLT